MSMKTRKCSQNVGNLHLLTVTIVKEHICISCHIYSLQLPHNVDVDILAGFLTCTQSEGVGCLQLPYVLASE